MQTNAKPRLLTPQEVARYLRVDLMTVYRWLNHGKLQGVKLGGRGGWRVRRRALRDFMQAKAQAVVPIVLPPTDKELERRKAVARAKLKELGF